VRLFFNNQKKISFVNCGGNKIPMMKIIFSILICTLSLKSIGQNNVVANNDSIAQRTLFHLAQKDFSEYEKIHGHYIQTNNVKMHYLTWGKPTDTPLVWIHGTYSNGYELYEIVDALVQIGFYVIAVDYYGHGLTPLPTKEVSLYHVADDIKFLLDNLKIKKAVIGGWSRGGSISTAFYDAYPNTVLGLILEDGGSVAWDVNNHKETIDSLTKETIENYKYRGKQPSYESDFDAYWSMYNYWGIKGKTGLKLKKEMFTCIARIKKDTYGKYNINPGVNDFTCENSAEQELTVVNRAFAANSLFGASTHLLYPKIIYRNLNVPMLIFDPTSKDDWFDFVEENKKLQQTHPTLITHKIYEKTWHGVKDERPNEVLKEIQVFLNKLKLFHKIK
jgi:pimeloyl-ACP methyl ester carboxylesterase